MELFDRDIRGNEIHSAHTPHILTGHVDLVEKMIGLCYV